MFSTEAGLAGDTMRRAEGDDSWNYIRIYSNIRQYIHVSPLGDNLFEFVYLKGHPALSSLEVSDDPLPGSWRSKDVFTPHPTIPDIWKYVTRLDDRVTLHSTSCRSWCIGLRSLSQRPCIPGLL